MKRTGRLYIDVSYDDAVTDIESLASGLDILLETAYSSPEILDDYGNPSIDSFYVLGAESSLAGIMNSITDSLPREMVVDSSDNDHKSGELYVDNPSLGEKYLITVKSV